MKTKMEAYKVIDTARDTDGRYSGMTYEQGIIDALEWFIEDIDTNPMEE